MLYIRDDFKVNESEIDALAKKIDQYCKDNDFYEYEDYQCDETLFDEVKDMLLGGSLTSKPLMDYLKTDIEESEYLVDDAVRLLRSIRDLTTRIDLQK